MTRHGTDTASAPSVFFTYRHESDAHRERVRRLAERLVQRGVAVVLDQLFLAAHPGGPDEGWPAWSMGHADRARRILIMASSGWFRSYEGTESPGQGLGAAAEGLVVRQRLYNARVNAIARIVTFEPVGAEAIPTMLQPYHRFDADADFEAIVAWVSGTLDASDESAVPEESSGWPAAPLSFAWEPADCIAVRDAFTQMVTASAQRRVLLVRGASETGKTHLTKHLRDLVLEQGGIACGRFDIKTGSDLDAEFELFVAHLGLDDSLQQHTGKPLRARLDAMMRELRGRRQATLLIFDTFEQGGQWAQWVADQPLSEIPRAPWLRVLISGQSVPNPAGSVWGRHAGDVLQLEPLAWKEWYDWGRRFKPDLREEFARDLHAQVQGRHGLLATVLGMAR